MIRCSLLLLLIACTIVTPAPAADVPTGDQIYKKKCATCHGTNGEGSDKHKDPLVGEQTVPQLAKVIFRTMPEDDPKTLSSEEAERVAAYIHETFYSPAARKKNQPRIELARLTVRQYRNAVADLVGSFRQERRWDEQRGLKAEYFKSRGFNGGGRVLERIDPEVRFDFGTEAPVADKMEPHEFSIRWTGSLLVADTGSYDFVIRTEHAARLWLNDDKRPLIDAWVKSGNDTEYRGSMYLIGGRSYPLRLEYTKAKQGVDDSKKKPKPPSAKSSIALEWKLPSRAAETIAARHLSPLSAPEAFVVATPFPPDDRSYGWERGTTVSRAWDQATTEAAMETAGFVVRHLHELAGTRDGAPDRDAKVRDFCRRFAERAFRRPLSDEQKRLIERQFEARDAETGAKRVVLLTLKSPHFLYRELGDKPDGYGVASRLAFSVWDSLPDRPLLEAAATGQLATREQVMRQAERMLADPRAKAKLQSSLLTWLKVDHVPDIAKDTKRFADFDPRVVADLRTSLELFLNDVVWSETADFRQLLLSDQVFLNNRLAQFYGADVPADAGFQKVKLDDGQRAGVLTHPYLMAAFAYTGESSPIHRGVFLARGVLGLSLRPPPEAFTPLPADLHPTLTTRERVALQTKATTCATCHGIINPLGFTLEHFDAVGRYRAKDNAKPVDATGSYLTRSGKSVTIAGARQLAEFLAGSEEVHDAFVEQLFHHLVQQPVRAYGPQTPAALRRAFATNGLSIRKLTLEIMAVAALTPRKSSPPD
jgi:cytochrome c553